MKNIQTITENDLRLLVSKTVKRVLLESEGNFVNDIYEYIKSNRLRFRPCGKLRNVIVEPSEVFGKTHAEYINEAGTVHIPNKKGEEASYPLAKYPYWGWYEGEENNFWGLTEKVLKNDYDVIHRDEQTGQITFRPKPSTRRLAVQIQDGFTFCPPNWGGYQQQLRPGDYLLQMPNDPNDIYGCEEDVFNRSYEWL